MREGTPKPLAGLVLLREGLERRGPRWRAGKGQSTGPCWGLGPRPWGSRQGAQGP